MINDIKGEKRIDLSYSIHSNMDPISDTKR